MNKTLIFVLCVPALAIVLNFLMASYYDCKNKR